jgi:hypothetical protein
LPFVSIRPRLALTPARTRPRRTATAEIYDDHDTASSVLAKRAAGYTSLGFPDPRRIPHTQFARSRGSR